MWDHVPPRPPPAQNTAGRQTKIGHEGPQTQTDSHVAAVPPSVRPPRPPPSTVSSPGDFPLIPPSDRNEEGGTREGGRNEGGREGETDRRAQPDNARSFTRSIVGPGQFGRGNGFAVAVESTTFQNTSQQIASV